MEIREVLARNGFTFKKKFGQNFLTDANLLQAIVRDSGAAGGTVLEIGTGAGTLTRALAEVAKRVVSYEIDAGLRGVLSETLSGVENAEVVFADFMKCDLAALERELGAYRVVANLPYYVTTPVLMRLVEETHTCLGVTVMVQEEVAERLAARAGTPAYGAVTAAVALRGEARIVRKVPAALFTPRPSVDSALVRIDFGGGVAVKSAESYRRVVRAAFSSRRKTFENNLAASFPLTKAEARALLLSVGVPEGARGETLPPETFAALADLFTERGIAK